MEPSFAAGTLIHTVTGLVPIESVRVGDAVISKRDPDGLIGYQRVLRTFSEQNRAVCKLSAFHNKQRETLIVGADHQFYISGYDTEAVDPDYLDYYANRTGWRRADLIDQGALLQLKDGSSAPYREIKRIWRTATQGLGWMQMSLDSFPTGYHIDLQGGRVVELDGTVSTDFASDESFRDRLDDEDMAEHWSYKSTVYGIEVEDFHTYFVGEMGIWVRDSVSSEPGRDWSCRFDESD